jgi:hypothetical protein
MKFLMIAVLTLLTSNAFAIATCEDVVVPLSISMAQASGQGDLTLMHFLGVSADYSEIEVTLGDEARTKTGVFKLVMGEEYQQTRRCVVKSIEAVR